jgi:pSer/pThr/pTyr-binding forkhead associated (FHA) protein
VDSVPETGKAHLFPSGPRLVALDGDCAGQDYDLSPVGDCLLSRAELPIVTIAQFTISAPHALIRMDKLPYRIKDLNSGNGTIVDGRRLDVGRESPGQKQATLQDGIQVVFGDIAFTFEETPPLLRDSRGKPYALQAGSRTIISRTPLTTRVVRDGTVSAPQTLIRREADGYTVRDLNSGNGTEVGNPVAKGFDYLSCDEPQTLRDGARLRLGHVLLEMRDKPQSARAGLPRHIDSYRIVGMVGVGGMAYVLEGRGPQGERVAVKIPKEVLAYDESFRERFRRETKSMERLEHPNIVRVLQVGEVKRGRHLVGDMGLQYIVMSYIDGCSLSRLLAEGQSLPDQVAVEIVRHVAQALQHAHEKGVIHRDIKPSNILISRKGEILITDFGIARAQGDATITRPGELPCSPQYVSPEHFTNKKVDEQSDLYSLGVVLYQMLTGKVPFDGNAPIQTVLFRHQSEEPVPPEEIRGDVPPGLAAIALKCLAKEPAERFDSAEALLAMLPPPEPAAAILVRMVAEASGKRDRS